MRAIAALQRADSGSISFDGIDILKQPQKLRQYLGYLPQDFNVYPRIEKGAEQKVPLDEWIDIGAFKIYPDKPKQDEQVLSLQKYWLKNGENHLELVLSEKPAYVGGDPFIKLVERDSKDNIFKL